MEPVGTLLYGGCHGALQIFENITHLRKNNSEKMWLWWGRVVLTFLTINITWVFFRTNIKESFYVIKNMFQGVLSLNTYLMTGIAELGIDWYSFITVWIFLFFLSVYDYISMKKDIIMMVSRYSIIGRWSIYIIFLILICIFSQKGVAAEFVYFQF